MADRRNALKEVGRHLAAARAEAGLTLREVGDRLSVSDPYLSELEHGRRGLSLKRALELLDVLPLERDVFIACVIAARMGDLARFVDHRQLLTMARRALDEETAA